MTIPEDQEGKVPDLKDTSDEGLYEWLKELTKFRRVKPYMFQSRPGNNTQLGNAYDEAEQEARKRGWTWQFINGSNLQCLAPPREH